ncbi:MAG: lytic transglycosylase domain-containing protein [Polyangiales bacterium]
MGRGLSRPHPTDVEAAEDAGECRGTTSTRSCGRRAGSTAATCRARAIGLLQMIPPTTRRAASELGIPFAEEMLYEPAYNIRVGGYYIGRLYRQYHGLLPRAIGSFNAGPGAMARWIREFGALPLDEFVERIPFDETRTYVRRVVQNLARYRYLYGPYDAQWPLRLPLSSDAAVDAIVDY